MTRQLAIFGFLLLGSFAPLQARTPTFQAPAPEAATGQVQGPTAASSELPGVREAAERVTSAIAAAGAGVAVVRGDRQLHVTLHKNFKSDAVLPISSASEWLAVATIMTLVDDGKLDLDVPVARYVEEFDRDDKRRLTLRQCLSSTSGLPATPSESMRGWTMKQFAEQTARRGLRDQASSVFLYGGVGLQVAAVAAERVSGRGWHSLCRERITRPLGMNDTHFGAFEPIGADAGVTTLPWVAGGAVSTLADYTRFVQMLVAKGEFAGQRILSEASVTEMLRDQVPQLVVVHFDVMPGRDLRYGLGTWIERLDDGVVRVTDPGAFGFTPWIDLDLGIGGVFAVQDRLRSVMNHIGRLQSVVREAVQSPAVAGTTTTVKLRHDGRERRYSLHVPPHQPAEALPLLLVLHGGGSTGEQMQQDTDLHEIGVQQGYVVAVPDGTGLLPRRNLTWNSGGIDVHASRNKVDDVGFLREVVRDIQQRESIDSGRVFAVGYDNGGMMCHRLAREAADVFAGIAVVAGAMDFTEVAAGSPLAVMLIHGTADRHVLLVGGRSEVSMAGEGRRVDAPLQAAIDYYVARNGLLGYPVTQTKDKVRIDTYVKAKGEGDTVPVRVVLLQGGGHGWPGGNEVPRLIADTPFPWPASRHIVEFFSSLQPANAAAKVAPPSVPR